MCCDLTSFRPLTLISDFFHSAPFRTQNLCQRRFNASTFGCLRCRNCCAVCLSNFSLLLQSFCEAHFWSKSRDRPPSVAIPPEAFTNPDLNSPNLRSFSMSVVLLWALRPVVTDSRRSATRHTRLPPTAQPHRASPHLRASLAWHHQLCCSV